MNALGLGRVKVKCSRSRSETEFCKGSKSVQIAATGHYAPVSAFSGALCFPHCACSFAQRHPKHSQLEDQAEARRVEITRWGALTRVTNWGGKGAEECFARRRGNLAIAPSKALCASTHQLWEDRRNGESKEHAREEELSLCMSPCPRN